MLRLLNRVQLRWPVYLAPPTTTLGDLLKTYDRVEKMTPEEQAVAEAEAELAQSDAHRQYQLEERVEAILTIARESGLDLDIPGYRKEETL